MGNRTLIACFALLVTAMLTGCKEEIAKVGEPAPPIAVFDAQQQPIKLEDYKGKPVILEFWSSTCGPCLVMMKEWEKLTKARPDDVAVVGINIDPKTFDLTVFAQEQGFSFPLGFDQLGITKERYLVSVTPTTFFLNKEGLLTKMHVGYSSEMNLDKYVNELLTK